MSDLAYVTEVFKDFAPLTSPFDIPVHENIGELVAMLMANKRCICISESGKGAILAMVTPHLWNPEILICQELGWWVEPEYRGSKIGVKLLLQLEKAAKEKGAKYLVMSCVEALDPEKVSGMYIKLGFRCVDHSYAKELI